jgi:hypothetical protein
MSDDSTNMPPQFDCTVDLTESNRKETKTKSKFLKKMQKGLSPQDNQDMEFQQWDLDLNAGKMNCDNFVSNSQQR